MKFIILLLHLTISTNSYSQKVTYKDLIGTSWMPDNLPPTDSSIYTFLDSTHYRYYFSSTITAKNNAWKFPNGMIFTYSLDTSYPKTLWHLYAYKEGKIKLIAIDSFIEFVDINTLKYSAKKGKKYTFLKRVN